MHQKPEFSEKREIIKFIEENDVKILNLCHIPENGRLKTLSFSATNKERVQEILEFGERVDGSNLFSYIEPDKSDVYITPRINRAFLNPFSATPTLNILCDYLDENGKPLEVAPKNVLARAEERLYSSTGIVLKALAEMEFYIISKNENETLFPSFPDKNYHESSPFAKFEDVRNEVLITLADIGIPTKYGHSEVGTVNRDGLTMEQHEIELLPQRLTEMAEAISITKWVIRNVCAKHGVSVSFSPKVALEHAGNGMHVHLCGLKNGRNVIVGRDGALSEKALKMIGGVLRFARSLTAFGNTVPVSYLRFISRKESPMHVCWGSRNRLALIRIPLWWSFKGKIESKYVCRRTFEYRAPDPLADAYLLFAGVTVAVDYALKNSREALRIAERLHVEKAGRKQKMLLPQSCFESAENLERDRGFYEAHGIFPRKVIDKTVERLKGYKDKDLWIRLAGKPSKIEEVLRHYLHYG